MADITALAAAPRHWPLAVRTVHTNLVPWSPIWLTLNFLLILRLVALAQSRLSGCHPAAR